MLRISFYGGPGVGKSTLAAKIYAALNQGGTAELVREFVKSWAYEGRQLDIFDQVYTFANQLWSEHRLDKAGVKVIVTDSPVLLQCVYADLLDSDIAAHLITIAKNYERRHQSLNFLVRRTVVYNSMGRYQSASELTALDARIQQCLDEWCLPYHPVCPDEWQFILQASREVAQGDCP
jgi:nicotinamide riboside kinase